MCLLSFSQILIMCWPIIRRNHAKGLLGYVDRDMLALSFIITGTEEEAQRKTNTGNNVKQEVYM